MRTGEGGKEEEEEERLETLACSRENKWTQIYSLHTIKKKKKTLLAKTEFQGGYLKLIDLTHEDFSLPIRRRRRFSEGKSREEEGMSWSISVCSQLGNFRFTFKVSIFKDCRELIALDYWENGCCKGELAFGLII